MALTRSVNGEGNISNLISFSSISGDATAYDQQYARLKSFISEASSSYRQELEKVMFPLFVNMYLELITNGQKTPASKFLSRHRKVFHQIPECSSLIEEISRVHSKSDIPSNAKIAEFRFHKCSVLMSEDSLLYLQQHLKNEDNVLLLQMFNNYIDIKVSGPTMNQDIHKREDRFLEGCEPVSQPCTPENKVIRDEVTLSSLQQCIRRVRDGPPCPTAILFYTLLNTYQGLCCSNVSPDESLLCAGFEDSSVRLWSLTADKMKIEPSEIDNSQLTLPLDGGTTNHQNVGREVETAMLRGHSGTVYGTSFVNDSPYLLSASEDKTVRLWDLKTCTNRVIYRGHTYPVWSVSTSTLGGYFASASQDRTAKIWSTDRTFPVRTLVGHVGSVDLVRFHPSSQYVLTGSSDRTVRMWSVADGRTVRLFQGHRGAVTAIACAPNGQLVASAGEDRKIKLWDLNSGSLIKDLKGHTDTILSLAFNRDSTMLASGGMDCAVRVWDVRKERGSQSSGSQENHSSQELLGVYPTKAAKVEHLTYAAQNFLLGVGNHIS